MDPSRELQPQDFGIGRLFWRIHEAVIVGDADTGQIVLWNPAAEALFGYTETEAVGRPIEILIPGHLQQRHRAGLERFAGTGQSDLMDADLGLELPAVHKSGRPLTIELLLSPVDDAPIAGRFVLAVIRDATGRKHAEDQRIELAREQAGRAEAEAAQQRFALLARASHVLASSLDWEATLANVARLVVPQFADWCVVDVVQDDGQLHPVEVAAADPSAEPLLQELVTRNRRSPGWEHHPTAVALRTGQPQLLTVVPNATLASIARDDEHLALILRHRPQSVIAVPLVSRERTLGIITFLSTTGRVPYAPSDIPLALELGRRATAAIEHASLYRQAQNAIALRDEFISVASHELRTPLTSLQGVSQLQLRRLAQGHQFAPDTVRATWEQINRQVTKLARLVSQLLDVSRLETRKLRLEPRSTDLAPLLRDAAADAQVRTDRHQFVVQCPNSLWMDVDPLRIAQVIDNLLDNAVKYSPDGGTIDVNAVLPDPDTVRITVADRGRGIPLEQRDQIFDRFYQANTGDHAAGMGLGLYVSREIILLHQGDIVAEERPDGGTCFVITLPVRREGTDLRT